MPVPARRRDIALGHVEQIVAAVRLEPLRSWRPAVASRRSPGAALPAPSLALRSRDGPPTSSRRYSRDAVTASSSIAPSPSGTTSSGLPVYGRRSRSNRAARGALLRQHVQRAVGAEHASDLLVGERRDLLRVAAAVAARVDHVQRVLAAIAVGDGPRARCGRPCWCAAGSRRSAGSPYRARRRRRRPARRACGSRSAGRTRDPRRARSPSCGFAVYQNPVPSPFPRHAAAGLCRR